MWIESPGPPFNSETDKEMVEEFPPLFVSPTYSTLQHKWFTKTSAHHQQVSTLMYKILAEDSSRDSKLFLTSHSTPSFPFTATDPLKIQQSHIFNTFSHLNLEAAVRDDKVMQNFESESLSIKGEHYESTSSSDRRSSHLIPWLKEKGYLSLAEKLELNTGYPWDEFKKVQSPFLIEQLVDIYLLCCHKKLHEEETEKLIKFALYLTSLTMNVKNEYTHEHEIINDVKNILGQLIYLINQDPNFALKIIDHNHYQKTLKSINETYNSHIQQICQKLQSFYLAHEATQLQDPEVALHARIPVEISRALLTEIGTINSGIIDSLSEIFLSTETRHLNHEINLSHTLTLLQQSPKLRSEFEKICTPNSIDSLSNNVIRASLELPPDKEINLLDARLATLTAILSHLRQGGDRSCFAVSLAIEMLSSHLDFCLKDFCELVKEGKLTRRIKKIKKDIPFAMRISDENLYKEIFFNEKGELITKAHLWEAPGILKVCQTIGLKEPKSTLLAVIHKLPPLMEGKLHKMEIKTLIAKICEEHKDFNPTPSTLDHMYTQACFAFSSQTAQPLLKVWENAIANMAEAEEKSMIKTKIFDSILNALQFKLGQLSIPPSPLLQRFFSYIQKLLHQNIQLKYDPTIHHLQKKEMQGIDGGFVLHYKQQKIEDEHLFRLFLQGVLQETQASIHELTSEDKTLSINGLLDTEINELNQTTHLLTRYIDSEEFMGYLLARYDASNKAATSLLSHGIPLDYTQLLFTPWITQMGNDSKSLLKIYLESEQPIQSEKIKMSGAEEALKSIIEMCKRMPEQEKKKYLNNPNKLKPFCILGKHRLPFMAGNPSLTKAWQQEDSSTAWIENFVLKPGKCIADKSINQDIKQKFIQHMKIILRQELPKENYRLAFRQIQTIGEKLTIKQYRNKILAICLAVEPLPKNGLINLTRYIDTALYESLTPPLKKDLENSAVHFADTNWCKDVQDLHFCFVVNPGIGELELWEAQSDGSHLTALDQHRWLINQEWEFLTAPENLLPDDSSLLQTP